MSDREWVHVGQMFVTLLVLAAAVGVIGFMCYLGSTVGEIKKAVVPKKEDEEKK